MRKAEARNDPFPAARAKARAADMYCIWLLPALAAAAMFVPVLLGMVGLFHDDLGMMVFPKYVFLARCFQNGVFPLWDPFIWCGGQPLFSHYYTELYYVPVWPFWRFADLSSLASAYRFMVIVPIAVHYAAAASGFVFLLRRRLGLGRAAALCGAAVFLFSPMFAYSYSWQQVVYHHAWVPWLLVLYDSAVTEWKPWKGVAGGAVFALLVLAANPGNWHLVFWLWAGWGCVCAAGNGGGAWRRVGRALLPAAVMLGIGCGLCAVYLFSVVGGYAGVSEHISLSPESVMAEPGASLPWVFLLTMFFPDVFGTVTGADLSRLSPDRGLLFWESGLAGGAAVMLLVLFGVFFSSCVGDEKRRRFVVFFSLLFVFSLLCATGIHSWFYRFVVSAVPGIGQLPRPIRYRFLQIVSAAVLSAFGAEALLSAAKDALSRMRVFAFCYVAVLCVGFAMALSYPLTPRSQTSPVWTSPVKSVADGQPGFGRPEWFSAPAQPVGAYSPPLASGRIAVYFDAPSQGEIRVSDRVYPSEPNPGDKVLTYRTDRPGWQFFDVRVPAGVNVWVCPFRSTAARVGMRRFRRGAPSDGYAFDSAAGIWKEVPDADIVCFEQDVPEVRNSPLRILSGGLKGNVTAWFALAHFAFAAALLVVAFAVMPGRRKARALVVAFAAAEAAVFCFHGFCGGLYSKGMLYENHMRSALPEEHPILARGTGAIASLSAADRSMRTMCSEPFHDNFGHLSGAQFLMGYEMHPLETRFKRALELALGQNLDYDVYYSQPGPEPEAWAFLDNFSVSFLVNRSPAVGFPEGGSLPLPGQPGYFVHTNARALPRVYTQARILRADEDAQLNALVFGDLRKAALVGHDAVAAIPAGALDGAAKGAPDFERMQSSNRVLGIGLCDPNRVDVEIDMGLPGLVVLTDVWFPGWKAELDGADVPVLRVNYCQRGVFVDSPGRHRVKFYFDPESLRAGMRVSLFFLAMIGLWLTAKGTIWLVSRLRGLSGR